MNSQQIVVMEITDPVMPDPRPQESANVPPGGEVAAATESIEPARGITLKWPTIWRTEVCPRREWSRGDASDIDEAQRGERMGNARVNRTCVRKLPLSCPPSGTL